MKPHFKTIATAILAVLIGGCMPAMAAVPLRWTVETSRAQPARYDVYRGETLHLSADLTSYGQPVSMAGTAALYIQTNGMGNAWWTIPATVSSNRIDATLSPSSYPATATTLNCFLGGPATSYRAAFVLRILGAPGPAPNTVEPPVVALDYDTITVLNAPYWTREEADARYGGCSVTATVVTNIAAAVVARDALPRSNGVANGLTIGGEFRLSSSYGDGDGTIQYAGYDADNYTEWWVGVPGFWLGTYRLRNPGSGNVATIAYTSDLPNLAPYAVAATVASNALPRAEAQQTYATQTALTTGLAGRMSLTGSNGVDETWSLDYAGAWNIIEFLGSNWMFHGCSENAYYANEVSMITVVASYDGATVSDALDGKLRMRFYRSEDGQSQDVDGWSATMADVSAISNRVDALETAVGTANALLQSALNGGSQQ